MKLYVNKEFTPSCMLFFAVKLQNLTKIAPSTAHLYEQTSNLPTPVEDQNADKFLQITYDAFLSETLNFKYSFV